MKNSMKLFFLVWALPLFAQEEAKPSAVGEFSFGVSGGVNFSNLLQGSDGAQNSITGFHFMGFVEYRFSDKFSIQPGVAYSRQGAETDDIYVPEFDTTTKFKMTLDYVNVPILLKYYVVKGFGVEAGPQVGFLTTAKAKDIVVDGESVGMDVDIKDMFKSVDFGIDIGASYTFDQGFIVGGRYNIGLSDIAEDNPDDPVTNSVFQLYLGFKY